MINETLTKVTWDMVGLVSIMSLLCIGPNLAVVRTALSNPLATLGGDVASTILCKNCRDLEVR